MDPSLARIKDSRDGPPRPEAVRAFPSDRSVYGAHDLLGTIREWCADGQFDGERHLRPVRGSCWLTSGQKGLRLTRRFGFEPRAVHSYIGLRVALRPPEDR
jgi:formylglycine-generating enzyme required for sulfatase activity